MPIDAETLDAIRAVVRDEIAAKPRKSNNNPDKRAFLTMPITRDEMNAIDAVCQARGCNRADFLRSLIEPVIGRVLAVNRTIPENFKRRQNRTKPSHHTDPTVDGRARDAAKRRIVEIGIERAVLLDTIGAANARAIEHGMLTEAAAARSPPKLGRS